jgi:alkylhydroperoxidase/carboxymuconolactone decarboxylase family protein YurZ
MQMPQLLQDIVFILIVVAGFAALLNHTRAALDRRASKHHPPHRGMAHDE